MRKMNITMGALALVAVSATPAHSGYRYVKSPEIDKSEPVEIRLKFSEGSARFVETDTNVDQLIKSGDQTVSQKIHSTNCLRYVARKNNGDAATLELQFDRMAMELTAPVVGTMTYDSDVKSPSANAMFRQIFEPMLHKPMAMEVTPNGVVKSFSGMNEIRDEVTKHAQGNMFWAQMQNAFSDTAAKIEYGEARYQFVPSKPVAVGDSWTVEREREMPGLGNKALNKTTYTLSDLKWSEDDRQHHYRVAVIEFKGTVEAEKDSDASPGANSMPKIHSGTMRGTIWFDLDRGRIIRSERESSSKLTTVSPRGPLDVDVTSTEKSRVLSKEQRASQRERHSATKPDGK